MKSKEKNILNDPQASYGTFSYADYLSWDMEEMVELIKGKIFRKDAAAPRRIHQEVVLQLARKIAEFLDDKPCKVFIAPFDVRLPSKSNNNEDIYTVVQPDICVVCDLDKLDEKGCKGAPDLIIEILSPGSNQIELIHKYEVYEESGVKEYWIIHPSEQTLLIYTLTEGKYIPSRLFTTGMKCSSTSIEGLEIDLGEIFGNLEG